MNLLDFEKQIFLNKPVFPKMWDVRILTEENMQKFSNHPLLTLPEDRNRFLLEAGGSTCNKIMIPCHFQGYFWTFQTHEVFQAKIAERFSSRTTSNVAQCWFAGTTSCAIYMSCSHGRNWQLFPVVHFRYAGQICQLHPRPFTKNTKRVQIPTGLL